MKSNLFALMLLIGACHCLTACSDNVLGIRNTSTWVWTTEVAISPDGKEFIALGGTEIRNNFQEGGGRQTPFRIVWDANGNVIRQLDDNVLGEYFRFTKDGTKIISGSRGSIVLLDTETGRVLGRYGIPPSHFRAGRFIESVALSPDGKYLLVLDAVWHIIKIDVQTGEIVKTIENYRYQSRHGFPSVILSPDGKIFAVCDPDSIRPSVRIYDIETENLMRTISIPGIPLISGDHRSIFTPDGEKIIISQSGGTIVIDLQVQEDNVKTFGGMDVGPAVDGHRNPLATDGQTLVIGSGDGTHGAGITVLDLMTGKILTFNKHSGRATSIAISPCGKYVLSSCRPHGQGKTPDILYWDIETGEIRKTFRVR